MIKEGDEVGFLIKEGVLYKVLDNPGNCPSPFTSLNDYFYISPKQEPLPWELPMDHPAKCLMSLHSKR